MDQLLLDRLNEAIENNLDNEQFGVEELAKESGLSRSQLHRKLHSLTGQSASQMIREYRLKKALNLLQDDTATVAEVSYLVGFGSPSYFNTCFNDFFGYPPGEVKFRKFANKKRKQLTPNRIIFLTMAIAIIFLLVYSFSDYLSVNKPELTKNADKSIAVLPFDNLSNEDENTYCAEAQTEYNRNIRNAGFEVLLHIGEIQRIVYLAHYDKDTQRGNPRSGWVEVLVISDLSQLMPETVNQAAEDLHNSWSNHWGTLGTNSDIGVADIDHKINQLRIKVLESLKVLD